MALPFIVRLCLGTHLRLKPEGLFAMLVAFGDESGTHNGSANTIMAGWLATVEQWVEIERRWSALLSLHGFTHFHAKELRFRQGQFRQLSHSKAVSIVQKLFDGFTDPSHLGIIVSMSNHDFEAYYRSQNKKHRSGMYSKYGVCFRVFLSIVAQIVEKYHPEDTVTITLEAGHKNSGAAEVIFAEFKKLAPSLAKYVNSVAYVTKEEAIGVQAADLLAYTYFRSKGNLPTLRTREVKISDLPERTSGTVGALRANITPETLMQIRSGQFSLASHRKMMRLAKRD